MMREMARPVGKRDEALNLENPTLGQQRDRPDLFDPATCGEDLSYNARRAMELAPIYCGACLNYHFLSPAKRLAGGAKGYGVKADRTGIVEIIAGLVAEAGMRDRQVDIVIVGTVDTGILATCAHAAFARARDVSSRVRFTVLDLCPTPLELCKDFAAMHGISLATDAVDLVATEKSYPADIVVHHSLFRFLPAEKHVATLRKFVGWLKPGGRLVFSMTIHPTTDISDDLARRHHRLELIRKQVEAGGLEPSEPREILYSRFKNYLELTTEEKSEFRSSDAVRQLFVDADVPVVSFDEVLEADTGKKDRRRAHDRALAVLKRPDEA
jgi:SAM-dependent methyltransferase